MTFISVSNVFCERHFICTLYTKGHQQYVAEGQIFFLENYISV